MNDYYKRVWSIARLYQKSLGKMFSALAVASILMVVGPISFAKIIESMAEGVEMLCLVFIVVFGVIGLIEQFAWWYKSQIEIKYYSFDLDEYLLLKIVDKYSRFSVGQIISRNSAYDQSLLISGKNALVDILKLMTFEVSPLVLELVCVMFTLFFFSSILGFVIIVAAAFFLLLLIMMDRALREGLLKNNKLRHAREKNYTEILRNMKLVLTTNRIDKSLEDFKTCNHTYKEHGKEHWLRFVAWSTFRELVLRFFMLSIIFIGVFYTDYSIGVKITAFILSQRVFSGMRRLNGYHKDILEKETAIKQFFDLLETEPDISFVGDPIILDPIRGDIEFQDLGFAYSNRNKNIENRALRAMTEEKEGLLENINLKINAGETVAIVGGTGGGKSTLISLLLRFFDPDYGKIMIDGYDLKNIDIGKFRERVGIVPQTIEFFDNTIEFNVSFASNGDNGVSLERSLEMSHLSSFCDNLEDGIDTVIGEGGITLSGGQRQRLAIARELMKNPDILIFDEATSSLDLAVEAKIMKSIEEVSSGKTTIIVAHRLSTMRKMKRIIVLDDGRIVGDAGYEELCRTCKEFQRLVKHL